MHTCTVGKSSVRNGPPTRDHTRHAELPSRRGDEDIDLAATPLRIPSQLRAEELRNTRGDASGAILQLMHEAHPTGENIVKR